MDRYYRFANNYADGWVQILWDPTGKQYSDKPVIATHLNLVGQTYCLTDAREIQTFLIYANGQSRPHVGGTIIPRDLDKYEWWKTIMRYVVLYFQNIEDNHRTEQLKKSLQIVSMEVTA